MPPDNLATETLGLRPDEAKNLLTRLQEVPLCNQIDEVLAASRICDDCGKRRAIHDDRDRILDTLYGRFRVKAPRLRQYACNRHGCRESCSAFAAQRAVSGWRDTGVSAPSG